MPHSELIAMLRAVVKEEMQPVRQELQVFQQLVRQEFCQVNGRLDRLEQGQKNLEERQAKLETGIKKIHKDTTQIKTEVRAIWEDIKKLYIAT